MHSKRMRFDALTGVVSILAGAAFAASAHAATPSPNPNFPSEVGRYVASTDAPDCFPSQGVCLIPGHPSSLVNDFSIFEGGNQTIVASVHYTFVVTDLSLKPIGSFFVFGTLAQTVIGRTSETQTGSWNSQVSWLKLNGEFINGKHVRIGLNTASPSTGQVSVTPTAGGFQINNTFDVKAALTVENLPPVQVNLGTVHVGLQPEAAATALLEAR